VFTLKGRASLIGIALVTVVAVGVASAPAQAGSKKNKRKIVQVARGGDALGGNGGNAGAGTPGPGITSAQAACLTNLFRTFAGPGGTIPGTIVTPLVLQSVLVPACFPTAAALPSAFVQGLVDAAATPTGAGVLTSDEARACLQANAATPGIPGGPGGRGGDAQGGRGGNNSIVRVG
jgi:hypothetical protein